MAVRNRVVISGALGDVERWSTAMHFVADDGGIVTDGESLTLWAQAIAAALPEIVGATLQDALSSEGTIDQIATYSYGPTGPAVGVGLAVATYSGIGTVSHPYQIASVISSRGAVAGSSSRGRNYWPAVGMPVGNDGLFSTPAVDAGAHLDFARLAEGIADLSLVTGGYRPVIYSPTRDLTTPVVEYRWGNVPDVQRRRVDALTETFLSTEYPV